MESVRELRQGRLEPAALLPPGGRRRRVRREWAHSSTIEPFADTTTRLLPASTAGGAGAAAA